MIATAIPQQPVTVAILAGGQSSRLRVIDPDADKGLIPWDRTPLIVHALRNVAPLHLDQLLIVANRHQESYRELAQQYFTSSRSTAERSLPHWDVIQDQIPNYAGPLAGVLAAMQASRNHWLLVIPVDTPNIRWQTLEALISHSQRSPNRLAWMHDGQRDHPTLVCIHRSHVESLSKRMQSGQRAVRAAWQALGGEPFQPLIDPTTDEFSNFNTPADFEGQRPNLLM